MADDAEGGSSFLTRKAFGGVPNWVWMLGALVAGYVVMQRKRGSSPAASTVNDGQSPMAPSPTVFFLPQGAYVTPSTGSTSTTTDGTTTGDQGTGTGNSGSNAGSPPGTGGPSPKTRYRTVTVGTWTSHKTPWNSTLWGIADHYKVAGGYQTLAKLNKIDNPNIIHPDQKIKVPIS
ncbi:LysM peptidoglycan-binding domain-containing protein [Streptomyces olivoreticuli]